MRDSKFSESKHSSFHCELDNPSRHCERASVKQSCEVLDSEISESKKLVLSNLPKTYLIDIDGTIAKHNGYLSQSDELLEGVKEFFAHIRECDKVILLTSRDIKYKKHTENFLKANGVRFDEIIFNLPFGERILINDEKPSGLKTAYAINKKRDEKLCVQIKLDENL